MLHATCLFPFVAPSLVCLNDTPLRWPAAASVGKVSGHMEQSPDVNSKPSEHESPLWGFDRDELAYVVPIFCFLLFVWVGSTWKQLYPWAYVARTAVAAALLIALRKRYTPIRWDYWWLGVIMGVLGIVQWIGMDSFLQRALPSLFTLKPADAFRPYEYFSNASVMWGWIGVRMLGASVVVPFMEELFWRDYLWRRIIAPADFKLASVGEWEPKAFFIVAIAFCIVHPQWLTAIGWGLMVGGLLAYTRSLGACIIMHGVTNLLLGLYVLNTHEWAWW